MQSAKPPSLGRPPRIAAWRWRRDLWLWPLASLLGACTTVPTPALIALPAVALQNPTTVSAFGPTRRVLMVHRLTIPEYMAARRVRYWDGPATLAEWPDAWWAERIEVGMAREFLAALRARLPGWSICDGSCGSALPDLVLRASVLRLDAIRRDRTLSARVRGQLSLAEAGAVPPEQMPAWSGVFTLPLPADSAQGEAMAIRALLIGMADAFGLAIENTPLPVAVVIPDSR